MNLKKKIFFIVIETLVVIVFFSAIIPLFKNRKNKLSYAIKQEITKIVFSTLEYKIDLSRLNVIELD